jgi:hypothetical protein
MKTGRLVGHPHLVLQVLAAVLEADARHLEVAGTGVDVVRRDGRPDEVDLGHGVVEPHHRREVVPRAFVALAGQVVEHVRGGAVARVDDAAVADTAVVAGSRPASRTSRGTVCRQRSMSSHGRRAVSCSASTIRARVD